MSLVVEGQTYKWEGGTLEELLSLLAEAALTVRVEALHADRDEKLGEMHVVAGGVRRPSPATAGATPPWPTCVRSPACASWRTPVLPDPEDGSLGAPGPLEGIAGPAAAPALMRYCENFVLTCALELRHGEDHVRISYRRGEILRTLVNGSESGERLPEVMSWTEGTWRIACPSWRCPAPAKAARPLRGSRRRQQHHLRLPGPAAGARPGGSSATTRADERVPR